jgi:hypothetical protein
MANRINRGLHRLGNRRRRACVLASAAVTAIVATHEYSRAERIGVVGAAKGRIRVAWQQAKTG